MSRKNTVLTIPRPHVAELVDRPFPNAKPGSVIIEQVIAPVCVEDMIWQDHEFEWHNSPFSLGHEGVGTVCEVPSESSQLQVGDRVLVFQGWYCGRCRACRNHLSPTHCLSGQLNPGSGEFGSSSSEGAFFIDGLAPIERKNESESGWAAMAQYRLADESTCYVLPDDLDFRYAAMGNCAMGYTVCSVKMMGVTHSDRLLIMGNGHRMYSFGYVIHGVYRGAKTIAAVEDDYQAEIIRRIGEARGGSPDLHIVDMRHEHWEQHVRDLTDGEGPDKVLEMTSNNENLRKALKLIAHDGGLHICENLYGRDRLLHIDPYTYLCEKNVQITANVDAHASDREGLMRMLRNKEVQNMLDVLITHEFPMSRAGEALDVAATRRCGKILLYPQE